MRMGSTREGKCPIMKAAWISNAIQGDLSIVVGETDDPIPREGEMVVAVEAVGLTFGEVHWSRMALFLYRTAIQGHCL